MIMNYTWLATATFFCAYALFVFLPNRRTLVALAGGLILILSGTISPLNAIRAVNWNVMGIFVGTLLVADIFMSSRVPAHVAEIILAKAKNTGWAILFICLLTGFISAFVENVATVLIVAPIALALAKKLDFNPTKMMIAIAISSNLQGTATLIGDPPSMLLGGFAGMNFMDFFFYQGRFSIFWAVEVGALASFLVLWWIFRSYKSKVPHQPAEKVISWFPTLLLIAMILLLAGSSFWDSGFSHSAGLICLSFGLIALIWGSFKNEKTLWRGLKSLDWDTTFFLMGVFILVGSITATGGIILAANWLTGLIGQNVWLGYTLIVFLSMFISGFVDNVPFLAAMLPVAMTMAHSLNINPSLMLFGLLIGTSLGGNITPIGASANIVACGILKKEGQPVKFWEFIKIGLPFTLAAVTAAYLFVWVVWSK